MPGTEEIVSAVTNLFVELLAAKSEVDEVEKKLKTKLKKHENILASSRKGIRNKIEK